MKKITNKGFAISTMLYGLLIMSATIIFMLLSSISFTKKSSTDFVNKVEKELNDISINIRSTVCPNSLPNEETVGNIIEAYQYDSEKCITGSENTCIRTECYESKNSESCAPGTIIKYKVNDTTIITFHVIRDQGSTIKMQTQRNIITLTKWNNNSDTTYGPVDALAALNAETSSWYNVNDIPFEAGKTPFSGYHAETGCATYDSCTTNKYTLPLRSIRARMISLQETSSLGCTNNFNSCPKWLYNHLDSYGSTTAYWTMSALTMMNRYVWIVTQNGNVSNGEGDITQYEYGIRPVVEINK